MKPVIKVRMFLQDGSLIFKPKDVMVVRFLVFLDGDEVSGYPVFFEGFQANFSIPIGSEIGCDGGLESQTAGRDRGIAGVGYGRHFGDGFIRNFCPESHAYFTVFLINIAMHARIFEANKGIDGNFPNGDEIVIIFHPVRNLLN